jgi:hypothetical protein
MLRKSIEDDGGEWQLKHVGVYKMNIYIYIYIYNWCAAVGINKLMYVKQLHGICIILII